MSGASQEKVRIPQATEMNLLGFMLAGLLRKRPEQLAALEGDVLVEASGMAVLLRFSGGHVEILREIDGVRPLASVRGTMPALLDAALGRGRFYSFLKGRLRVRGRPFALLTLLRLLRV
jgi:hypothetical protein